MTHHNGPTVDQFQGAVHRHRVVGAQLRAGAVAAWGVDHPHQCGAGVRAVGGHHGGTRAQPERVGRGSDQAQGRIPAAILICWSSPARRATSTCWIATTSAAWASPPPAATRWYNDWARTAAYGESPRGPATAATSTSPPLRRQHQLRHGRRVARLQIRHGAELRRQRQRTAGAEVGVPPVQRGGVLASIGGRASLLILDPG